MSYYTKYLIKPTNLQIWGNKQKQKQKTKQNKTKNNNNKDYFVILLCLYFIFSDIKFDYQKLPNRFVTKA